MSVGNNLRKARLAKGITLEEAGKAIGVQKSAVLKYENGSVTNIPVERIQKLAKLYGVSPADIMEWKDEKGEQTENEMLKFALFGGADDITDAMIEEVRQFAKMVKLREDNK